MSPHPCLLQQQSFDDAKPGSMHVVAADEPVPAEYSQAKPEPTTAEAI